MEREMNTETDEQIESEKSIDRERER